MCAGIAPPTPQSTLFHTCSFLRVGFSGKGRWVCVSLVCVVRMWLAPLPSHDLLTIIPTVVRA